MRDSHQLSRHDLPLVHEIIDEAVLLPVYAGNLPRQLVLALSLMFLVDCLFHLRLKVLDDFLYELPSFWGLLILQATPVRHPAPGPASLSSS